MSHLTIEPIIEQILEIVRDELSENFVFNETFYECMGMTDIEKYFLCHEKLAPLKIGIAMMRRILDNSKDKVKSVVEEKLKIKLEFIPSDCNKSLPFNDQNKKLLKFMVKNLCNRKAEIKRYRYMSVSDGIIQEIFGKMKTEGFQNITAKKIRDLMRAFKQWILKAMDGKKILNGD